MDTTCESVETFEPLLMSKRQDLLRELRAEGAELETADRTTDLDGCFHTMKRREQVFETLDLITRTICQVDAALRAMADGSYGLCISCRTPIARSRLDSVPWTTYCLHCQTQLER
jgi:DnaK suppressor protein